MNKLHFKSPQLTSLQGCLTHDVIKLFKTDLSITINVSLVYHLNIMIIETNSQLLVVSPLSTSCNSSSEKYTLSLVITNFNSDVET